MVLFSFYFSGLLNRIMRKIFNHWRLEPVYVYDSGDSDHPWSNQGLPILPYSLDRQPGANNDNQIRVSVVAHSVTF